jgi:hypothetical protein
MRDRRADSRLDTILFLFLSSMQGTLSELELGCCWIGPILFARLNYYRVIDFNEDRIRLKKIGNQKLD